MKLLKKTITLFIIITCLITLISPLIAQAVNVNYIRTATTDEEKRVLLGGLTADEARDEYLLGIASQFAVFVQENFSHGYSDVGGKAAIGGDVTSKSSYGAYNTNFANVQIGCERYNYGIKTHDGSADVVLGSGFGSQYPVSPCSATKSGRVYDMDKLIAVPMNADINWSNISDAKLYTHYGAGNLQLIATAYPEDVYVRADLIDFDEEFEYLRTVSQNLASMETTGTIIESEESLIVTNLEYSTGTTNSSVPGTVFRGENQFYNVFNVTSEKWNLYDNIIFDVPYNSYVIVNIDGNKIAFSDKKTANQSRDEAVKNIFYPISRSEILKEGLVKKEAAYLIDRDNPVGDTARDEEGYVKTYVKLLSSDEKNWDKGEYILYNLSNATSFTFDGNCVGTVLAPMAKGSSETIYNSEIYNYAAGGHLAGNLICKSFNGYQEIGNTLFSMPNSYFNLEEIEICKANSFSNTLVEGATMRIRDLEGNVLYQWETTNENKKVQLPKEETFVLEEVNVPDGYMGEEPIAFQIDKDGNVLIINKVVNYYEMESIGTTYLNLTTEEAKKYVAKNEINKIEFVPDTSESVVKADWNLDCTVSEAYRGGYMEDLKWTHTADGEIVTAYFPRYEVAEFRGWDNFINFYRGDTQVSDVKLKSLTTYSDKLVTKKTASGELDYVEADGKILTFYNTPDTGIKINIDKVEKDSKVKVAGVGFGLYALEKNVAFEKDELVAAGVTDATGNLVLERYGIPGGKYYIKEMSAPSAYVPLKSTVEYSLGKEIVELNIEIENEVAKTTVNVSKKFKGEDKPVKDVEFGVFAAEDIQDLFGNYIWKKDDIVYKGKTAEDGTIKIVFSKNDIYRPLGKYYLKEIDGPEYLIQSKDKYEFEILQNVEEYKFDVENDYTKLEVTKIDKGTGEPVVGAKLQIQNEAGEVVEEFTTTEKAHRIDKIAIGKYKLVETEAPAGYLKAEDVAFEVEETAEVQTVEMEEDYTKLEIIKTDKETGEKVPGAKLQVQNEAGEVVEEFTTTENAYRIDRLSIGKYKLVEIEVPEGYLKAEPVEFEVTETAEVQTVEMKEECTKLEITKTDKETGEPIVGVKLQIQDLEGNVIEEWVTDGTPHKISKLPAGKYKIVVVEAPEGYLDTEDVEFEITEEDAEIKEVNVESEKIKEETNNKENEEDEEQNEPIKPEEQDKTTKPEKPVKPEDNKPSTSDKKEETDKSESSAVTGDKIILIAVILVVASIILVISIKYGKTDKKQQ